MTQITAIKSVSIWFERHTIIQFNSSVLYSIKFFLIFLPSNGFRDVMQMSILRIYFSFVVFPIVASALVHSF